jgi:hypothetical protein
MVEDRGFPQCWGRSIWRNSDDRVSQPAVTERPAARFSTIHYSHHAKTLDDRNWLFHFCASTMTFVYRRFSHPIPPKDRWSTIRSYERFAKT